MLPNSTTPEDELDALTMTANLTWIVKQTLESWITSHISLSDNALGEDILLQDVSDFRVCHKEVIIC